MFAAHGEDAWLGFLGMELGLVLCVASLRNNQKTRSSVCGCQSRKFRSQNRGSCGVGPLTRLTAIFTTRRNTAKGFKTGVPALDGKLLIQKGLVGRKGEVPT